MSRFVYFRARATEFQFVLIGINIAHQERARKESKQMYTAVHCTTKEYIIWQDCRIQKRFVGFNFLHQLQTIKIGHFFCSKHTMGTILFWILTTLRFHEIFSTLSIANWMINSGKFEKKLWSWKDLKIWMRLLAIS